MTAHAETVLDNFNSAVFSGNNGTQNWATDWVEINESDGATSGDIQIVTNAGDRRLQIKDNGSGSGEGAYREANLSGATAATLSFVYKRTGLDNSNDYVKVEVSGDGGLSWTELDRFTGWGSDSSYRNASYDITSYIASNTRIRFLSSPWLGNSDVVYFDDVQIDYTVPTVPHFSISHDGAGTNCAIENITIARHAGAHTTDTTYTGTITLSTTTATGDWSVITGSGTLNNGTANDGAATYVFNSADNGQVVLGLSHTTAGTVNINITDGTYSEDGTEDADMIFTTTSTDTYADDFSVTSYSNSTGSLTWATDWLEINESDGAANGDVRVATDSGSRGLRLRDGIRGIQREFDISTATSAILTFDYRRDSMGSGDTVTLQASNDGGSTWTTIDTFSGPATDSSYQAASYNITAYAAANARIRFMTSSGMDNNDRFWVDNVLITASIPGICGGIDHFAITVPASASACDGGNASITITAEDASNAVVTSYVGLVNLSVSNGLGDWSSVVTAGTLNNGTADDGAGTYQFVVGDNGTITLELAMSVSATVTVTVAESAGLVSSTSAAFDFVSGTQSFLITNDTVQVAGRPQAMTISRLKNDCTVMTTYNNTIPVKAWLTRDGTDPSGAAPSISAVSLPDAEPASDNLTGANQLTFASGVASFNLDTTDIGKYILNIKDNHRAGSSPVIITRPFGFDIDFTDDRQNNGITGISYSADETGSVFAKAGNTFATTITAVQWQLADDADNNGVPDTGANLTDNTATISFGLEGATVDVTHTLNAPAAGTVGTLSLNTIGGAASTALSAFTSGSKTVQLVWDEVGIIDLNANITGNNYWGSGVDVTGSVTNVGRFYPDHFALSSNTITNRSALACVSSFTYMDEAFSADFTLTAQNSANATTTNYNGVFAKLDTTTSTQFDFAAVNNPAGTPSILTSRLDLGGTPTGTWANGVAVINYPIAVLRNAAEDGPYALFNLGIAPTDSDGVLLNTYNLDTDATVGDDHGLINTTQIRFGRIAMSNAFGSELLDLNIPMLAQYFDGTGFINAGTDDTCTTPATITITDVTAADSMDATVDTCVLDTGNPGTSNSGCATAAASAYQYQSPPALAGSEGSFNLYLQAPGAGKSGEADVSATVPAYMQYDWDGNGTHDNNPTARATFGIYKGKTQMIYMREGR